MLTGHVNLVITKPRSPRTQVIFGNKILTIDFDPFVNKKSFPKVIISQSDILSMFYSNKGAQALVNKQYTKAYAYLKSSIKTAPNYSPAWANLGLLYRMNGYLDTARKTYRLALNINPKNYTAMYNLSLLLDDKIDRRQLSNIRLILISQRENNPYYYALLADEAFYLNNYKQSLSYYRKAIKMNSQVHEFYFGLAKVYYALNKYKSAQKAIAKALKYNSIKSIDVKYLAKLNFLKQRELSH